MDIEDLCALDQHIRRDLTVTDRYQSLQILKALFNHCISPLYVIGFALLR
ncbi:MAG: hypothetical protein A4E62_01896 [Syntrophorhabdus sp. PtaU1.Bin002]|nr:MAG: hypothetical protein A4E62_01896 [Syntrophorhabdus sp. PtaU1.Bin002]